MDSIDTKPNDSLYYARIRGSAAVGHDRVIENGRPEHAVYLLRQMFKHAKDKVRLFPAAWRAR